MWKKTNTKLFSTGWKKYFKVRTNTEGKPKSDIKVLKKSL